MSVFLDSCSAPFLIFQICWSLFNPGALARSCFILLLSNFFSFPPSQQPLNVSSARYNYQKSFSCRVVLRAIWLQGNTDDCRSSQVKSTSCEPGFNGCFAELVKVEYQSLDIFHIFLLRISEPLKQKSRWFFSVINGVCHFLCLQQPLPSGNWFFSTARSPTPPSGREAVVKVETAGRWNYCRRWVDFWNIEVVCLQTILTSITSFFEKVIWNIFPRWGERREGDKHSE